MIRQLFRSPLALLGSLFASKPVKKTEERPAPVPVPKLRVIEADPAPIKRQIFDKGRHPLGVTPRQPEPAYIPSREARNARRRDRIATRAFVRALNQGRG